MQTTTAPAGTDTLNSLLRGEMAAVETYRQAIEKVGHEAGADQLRLIEKDHRAAVDALRQHVGKQGGKPSDSSGAWGSYAKAVEGTAKVFGNAAALKALKEGEEHGVKEYQAALDDKDVPADLKQVLRGFMGKQREHLTVLDHLLAAR